MAKLIVVSLQYLIPMKLAFSQPNTALFWWGRWDKEEGYVYATWGRSADYIGKRHLGKEFPSSQPLHCLSS